MCAPLSTPKEFVLHKAVETGDRKVPLCNTVQR